LTNKAVEALLVKHLLSTEQTVPVIAVGWLIYFLIVLLLKGAHNIYMNFKFLLVVFFNISLTIAAGAQVKTVYLSDFGAIANDNRSDQQAFNKAAGYINAHKGNTRLIISQGKYLVGNKPRYSRDEDIPTGAASLNDVMNLMNCNNVTIEGAGNVMIKFEDGLPFGTLPNRPGGADSAVHIGSLFRLTNCTNFSLLNFSADGNNENFRLLKFWGVGNNAYERENEGLFILNCQQVTVNNVSFKGFGRDGAMILQDADKIPVKNIFFTNCSFNNNGRNGLSWCGGENIRLYNCQFNNNGKGKIVTNPSSGLDIEPERNALCKKGIIIKCEFSNNAGYSVVSGYTEASDVTFDSCTITGNSNYALFSGSPGFTFKNTAIAGSCLLTYDAANEKEGMNFTNCTFTDSLVKKKIFAPSYLVAITGRYAKFESCSFTSYKKPVLYTEVKKKKSKEDPENSFFNNCSFNVYFKKASTWGSYAFLVSHSKFVGCTFRSGGYADFKRILNDTEKNVQQQRSIFINN
jgi:hypothetical protein